VDLNNELKIKLGDFGLAKNMSYDMYLQHNQTQPLPVRWMSPEALQFGQYSSKSDVW
jgi:serine/threonine protein kinase